MLQQIDLQPAERALDKARTMLSKINDPSFSWPDRKAFEADIENTTTLLTDMQLALSGLIVQISEHAPVVHEQQLESEVSEAIHKSFNLLSRLYDDLHAIEDDGPDGATGKNTLEKARIHFQQITSHYAITRDRLLALEDEFGLDN